mgnify:CR=1 FL=1|tara:strand:- start:11034 stop:11687 length:654 start_codon:yes stop_codon:yes gene_type:complete
MIPLTLFSGGDGPGYVTDGLDTYLDAHETSSYPGSGSTWYDISGNGHNFALHNTTFNADSYWGNEIRFSTNANAYAQSNTGSNVFTFGSNSFSVEFWYRYGSNGDELFEHKGGQDPVSYEIKQESYFNHPYIYHTQYVWTRDGSSSSNNYKLYKNGQLIYTDTLTKNISVAKKIYIGRDKSGTYHPLFLSVFRVYKNKLLTAAEVLQNYNAHEDRYA